MMNNFILVLLIGILKLGTIDGQCCPYLGNIEIIPESPTITDSIYLVANVTTPHLGSYLGYTKEENSINEIKVRACYWEGVFAVLTDFTDTINLGVKDIGLYTIEFTAVSSLFDFDCTPIDSTSIELTIEVVGTIATIEKEDEIKIRCYPNPLNSQELHIYSSAQVSEIIILDTYGRIFLREGKLDANYNKINTDKLSAGAYFIKVIDKKKNETIKKIIKLK